MSKYKDALAAKRKGTPQIEHLSPEVRHDFPEISALLGGEKNPEGQWDPSPCTISLFMQEGRLTACIKPKHDNLIAFTTISEPAGLLEALEGVFCKTDLDWKLPIKRKGS